MSFDQFPPEDDNESNQYDDFRDQYDDERPADEGVPKARSGRTFLTIVGVIGAVVVLSVIALVIYFFVSKGQLTNRFQEQAAQINAENTATAMAATQESVQELARMTEKAMLPPTWTPTLAATKALPATATPRPTNTTAPTSTAISSDDSTATAVAFLTQSVAGSGSGSGTQIAQVTAVQTTQITQATTAQTTQATQALRTPTATKTSFQTPTALPATGFADDVGLPGMLGLAVVLIAVVFLARRIRLSPSH